MGYRLSPAVWNASRLIYPRWCRSGFPHSQRATLRERCGNYRQRQKAQWPEIPRPRRVGRIASMGRFFINGCRTTGRLACPTPMRAPSCQMFLVDEADVAAIRVLFNEQGELSAAIELHRRFPGIADNAEARE